MRYLSLFAFCCLISSVPAGAGNSTVARAAFGLLPDGRAVELFTLNNSRGMEVRVTNYGGIITSIKVPDRHGKLDDIVLGHDSLDGYLPNPAYLGAVIGRYANRIGRAQFTLDGTTYRITANHQGNALHGGINGFDQAVWQAESFKRPGQVGLVLRHTSPDGDQGFPGRLAVRMTYTLTDRNELSFDYSATTNRPTVLNLTHHDYFNLTGEERGEVLRHVLMINADRYTPVDATLVPRGDLADVAGTPFDFRHPTPIGARIDAEHPQIRLGAGYDHNFAINRRGDELVLAARVEEPTSGRVLEVHTTEPGLQFYVVGTRDAFSLETQHFPDTPNKSAFPSTTLRPGEVFRSRTVYAFSTK